MCFYISESNVHHMVPQYVIVGVKLHPTGMCILKIFSSLKTYCMRDRKIQL